MLYAVPFFVRESLPVGGGGDALVSFKKAHKIFLIPDAHLFADLGQCEFRRGNQEVFGYTDALAVQIFRDSVPAAALEEGGQIRGVVSKFFRNAGYGKGSVIVELQPFHKVGDLQGNFFILLQQPMAEETFVGKFQQQGTLGVAALRCGKTAQTLGQIKELDEQHIDPAVGGEGAGLWQNIARAGGIMKTGGGLLFLIHGGVLGTQTKMCPVKRQFPLGGPGSEMAFSGEKEQELAGG